MPAKRQLKSQPKQDRPLDPLLASRLRAEAAVAAVRLARGMRGVMFRLAAKYTGLPS